MKEEAWLPIADFEGYYEVSDQGRVRGLDRTQLFADGRLFHFETHILSPAAGERGHLSVVLCKEGRQRTMAIHRLVAQAFIPNPDGLPLVRHWDDVKTNNHVENLRWGEPEDNAQDALRNGRNFNANKTHCKRGHEFTPENTYHPPGGNRQCRTCNRDRVNAFKAERRKRKKMIGEVA